MTQPIFEVGDVVSAFGREGIVVELAPETYTGNSVMVRFQEYTISFKRDGKLDWWHAEPSLKLVRKAKKNVTKAIERWVNVYPNGIRYELFYDSEREANQCKDHDRIGPAVKLTGTYEVEE